VVKSCPSIATLEIRELVLTVPRFSLFLVGGRSPLARSSETISGTGYLVPQLFVAGGNRIMSGFVGS
jgi:hypothetical protein